uniref:Uncharacterized protein n=1 Tax=Octopus bimaculoides TaxID=37653 RepID=A0A0L8GCH7_OCTBM
MYVYIYIYKPMHSYAIIIIRLVSQKISTLFILKQLKISKEFSKNRLCFYQIVNLSNLTQISLFIFYHFCYSSALNERKQEETARRTILTLSFYYNCCLEVLIKHLQFNILAPVPPELASSPPLSLSFLFISFTLLEIYFSSFFCFCFVIFFSSLVSYRKASNV